MRRTCRALVLASAAASVVAPVAAASNDDPVTQDQLFQKLTQSRLSDPLLGFHLGGGGDRVVAQPGTIFSPPSPRAVTDAVWIGLGNNNSWLNSSNWSTNLVPDGEDATARFRAVSSGPIAQLGSASITLSTLEMSDPLLSAVVGGTINLTGIATVHANGVSFELPNTLIVFEPANLETGAAGNTIGGSGSFATSISGSAGLNKTGDTHIQFDSPNHYTGSTTISGGRIYTTIGDEAFGNFGNGIVLNGGGIVVDLAHWVTSRDINVLDGGGTIIWSGPGRTFQYSGAISGTGELTLHGGFGPTGSATFTTSQSHSGTFTLGSGTLGLSQSGAMTGIALLRNQGTLVLDNTASESSVDRLSNSVPILMRGAALTTRAPGSGYSETVGPVTLDGGVSFFTAVANGNAQLHLGALTRDNAAGAVFRGMNLGSAPALGTANIFIANGASFLKKGIIPFAYGNANFNALFSLPESPDNTLVTYGANGVAPITNYASSFVGSGPNTNVRITANATLAGNVSANALVLSAPANLEADGSGAGLTLSGGTLVLDSGVILSGHAGFISFDLGLINALPGNVIHSSVSSGSNELVMMTPSALTIHGVISGSGGLTKLGGRTAHLTGANTYTGPTTLNGLVRFTGNVASDGVTPGPFGLDTSPIVLYGGTISPQHPVVGESGSGFAQLGGASSLATSFNRAIDARGTQVLLRNFGLGELSWNGNITLAAEDTILSFVAASGGASGSMTVNGVISGPGRVQNFPNTTTSYMNANTFTGGFDLDGTVLIGHDQALSTGSIIYHSNLGGTLSAVGGARTLANDLVILAGAGGSLTLAGEHGMTFSGSIIGRGGDYLLNVTNTATTTFSGVLSGGAFRKTGAGTLVLSGENIFDSIMTVGSGSIAGGMVIVRNNLAPGTVNGPTFVEFGENTLALDGANSPGGSLNTLDETLILTGDGISGLGALRNLSGDNVWNGIVRPTAHYQSTTMVFQRSTIGVDSGTLTVNSTILTSDPGVFTESGVPTFLANSIGLRKLGPGALVVGSDVISTAVGSANFEWNGAIVASGSLDIQAGAVYLKPGAGIGTIASGKTVTDIGGLSIAGGPASPMAKLDIGNNGMVIDYDGASPLADIRAYILAGRNGGNWQGNGITSALAGTTPNPGEGGRTAIGFGEASAIGASVFMGNPVDNTSVLVKYTYEGDADLNGRVDVADLGRLASSWQTAGSWINGDFDYSGFIDVNDLGKLASNWQVGVGAPLTPTALPWDLSDALASLGLPNVTIPEPHTTTLLCTTGIFLHRRRRNNRHKSL